MAITNSLTDLGNLTGNAGTGSDGYKVSNLYKQAYSDAVRLQIQQFDSLLSDTLTRESIEGEVKSFDRLDKKSVDDLLVRTRSGLYGIANGVAGSATLAADAVYGASDTQRRMIEPQWFEYAELFDPRDSQGLMKAVRPDSQYLRNLAAIFNRKKDLIILDALTKPVLVQQRSGNGVTVNKTVGYTDSHSWTDGDGTATDGGVKLEDAYEGLEIGCGLSSATLTNTVKLVTTVASPGATWTDADILIAGVNVVKGAVVATNSYANVAEEADAATASYDIAGSAITKFNVEKLIRARQKLDANNALMPGTRYICVLHPDQFYSLLSDKEDSRLTSIDFNDGKPLTSGEVFRYMGFEFRITNILPQASFKWGTNSTETTASIDIAGPGTSYNITQASIPVRYAYFYTEQCGIFGMNADMSIRFDEIPERGYALQMWHQIGMNAIRMDGDCIVRVGSIDDPA